MKTLQLRGEMREELNMKKMMMVISVIGLIAVSSVFASENPQVVNTLVKCHEGKFSAQDATGELNGELAADAVYASNSWNGDAQGQLIEVKAPFTVSAPTFVNDNGVFWACVTVTHQQ
jgi:hypothetical protein